MTLLAWDEEDIKFEGTTALDEENQYGQQRQYRQQCKQYSIYDLNSGDLNRMLYNVRYLTLARSFRMMDKVQKAKD